MVPSKLAFSRLSHEEDDINGGIFGDALVFNKDDCGFYSELRAQVSPGPCFSPQLATWDETTSGYETFPAFETTICSPAFPDINGFASPDAFRRSSTPSYSSADLENISLLTSSSLSPIHINPYDTKLNQMVVVNEMESLAFEQQPEEPLVFFNGIPIERIERALITNEKYDALAELKYRLSMKMRRSYGMSEICGFCACNNKNCNHPLKLIGPNNKPIVTCPVLRQYKCPFCESVGDNAHTKTYCPKLIAELGHRPAAVAKKLAQSLYNAAGKRRVRKGVTHYQQQPGNI